MRIIKAPPPDLTKLLFDLGNRSLVLVEGESDCRAFEEWYQERLGDVMFHTPGGGSPGVQSRLTELLTLYSGMRAFGIIDRDFRSDQEVAAPLGDPMAHLFILRRYTIENYLLEPAALREELRVFYSGDFEVPDIDQIASGLLALCSKLGSLMAANWLFFEVGGIEHFPPGHNLISRDDFIALVASRLGITRAEAEQTVAKKEDLLAPRLATLDTAHTCINGKHLFYQIYTLYITGVRKGLVRDHLFSLLVRTIKAQGLHKDIRSIIDDRILRR